MAKITKRFVDGVESRAKDFVIWDDDLPGFGLRVFATGKRSYVIQYRSEGRSRRYTIGLHGIWTPETARREAKIQFGKIAQGENPAETKLNDYNAITMKELCELYMKDMLAGLVLGKGGRPKKPRTVSTDIGRINGHIIPLIGNKRVRDLTKSDVTKAMNDIIRGTTRVTRKTKKLRGKSIIRGGPGTARRTVGLIGGILSYAISAGIIENNVAHGIRKPKYHVRTRRLSENEYKVLGSILNAASENENLQISVNIIRLLALTGCRRSEIINLKWAEIDLQNSCLRLVDTKEGASTRPLGLPVVEFLERQSYLYGGDYVFPSVIKNIAFSSFPKHWKKIIGGTELEDITPHVLRHSFASVANDLGFSEITIAALLGHSKGSMTSKYVHTLDTTLIMAADTISGYIRGLLDGVEFRRSTYALDLPTRRKALEQFLEDVRS